MPNFGKNSIFQSLAVYHANWKGAFQTNPDLNWSLEHQLKTLKLVYAFIAGANEPTKSQLRYKQWKFCSGCLEKFSLGISEGHQTFQRGAAPWESLMTRGNSLGQIFQTTP